MTRFCIVAPPQVLKGLRSQGLMGAHHLLLAHDVVAQADEYLDLFADREGWPGWEDELVILDNSVIELGTAVDLGMINAACEIVRPTCVVLPDVLLDGEATAEACLKALDVWPKHLPEGTKYCYIPQGKKLTEFIASARAIADHPDVTFWGCPRNVVKHHGTRTRALACLEQVNPTRKIHMMGFSDNMMDDVYCARAFNTYSIDSAVPLRLKHPLRVDADPTNIGTRGDWWDTGLMTQFTIQNLEIARKWFNGPTSKLPEPVAAVIGLGNEPERSQTPEM